MALTILEFAASPLDVYILLIDRVDGYSDPTTVREITYNSTMSGTTSRRYRYLTGGNECQFKNTIHEGMVGKSIPKRNNCLNAPICIFGIING